MHMTITDDFSALGLSEQMLAAVRAKGFETPTAIQKLTIPHLLTKPNDIIAQSQTGTGKTAAYGLPILQTLEPARGPIQAIILVRHANSHSRRPKNCSPTTAKNGSRSPPSTAAPR